ncbi:hypothetical protein [Pelagibius sp. Alg239-R121]|nr:hypothetical protein [Pelagibius sp. Alg239-R121]
MQRVDPKARSLERPDLKDMAAMRRRSYALGGPRDKIAAVHSLPH